MGEWKPPPAHPLGAAFRGTREADQTCREEDGSRWACAGIGMFTVMPKWQLSTGWWFHACSANPDWPYPPSGLVQTTSFRLISFIPVFHLPLDAGSEVHPH